MDSFKLKVFAISVMLIDHAGIILVLGTKNYWLYLACRAIGRLAFPIFAFMIVEGYLHTSNFNRYLKRLLAFAFISEFPFDLALYQYHFNTDPIADIKYMIIHPAYSNVVINDRLMQYQNIFFTLSLGLILIYLFNQVEIKFIKNDFTNIALCNTLEGLLTIAFCAIAYFIKADYEVAGILIIAAFYLFRDSKAVITIILLFIAITQFCNFTQFSTTGNWLSIVSILAVLAIIPIAFYNGKKGKSIKYFFYAFYPVHLICLLLIAYIFKLS